MKEINNTTLNQLRKSIDKALKQVAEEHNISLAVGTMRYSSNDVKMKLTATLKDESGKVIDKDAEQFKLQAELMGLKESDLGRKVTISGQLLKVVGYNSRSFKYPFILQKEDGSKVKARGETVVKALKA